jgi:hypothetical protein
VRDEQLLRSEVGGLKKAEEDQTGEIKRLYEGLNRRQGRKAGGGRP